MFQGGIETIRTIVAIEQGRYTPQVLVLNFEVPNVEFDLIAAVKAACKEYCQTEDGKRVLADNFDYFNWGDFDKFVPDCICRRYGFLKLPKEVSDTLVHFEEHLVSY